MLAASLAVALAACNDKTTTEKAAAPAADTKAAPAAVAKSGKYTVLHLNDTHGHFWEDKNGQGGFAYIKTIINNIRKENDAKGIPTIVLHAGDFNTGVPTSDVLKAVPDIIAMNDIGFDAITIGNHEFDVSEPEMIKQRDTLTSPLITANIVYKNPETGKEERWWPGYNFVNKNGLNFLIVGTTTPSTKYQANPVLTKNFEFLDPKQAFDAAVKESEEKNGKADVVISNSHLGLYFNGDHGDMPYGDWILAQKNGPGVALYVTGHTHVFGCVNDKNEYQPYKVGGPECKVPVVEGAPLVQASKWGNYVGRADFELKDGVSTLVHYELIPVNQKVKKKDANGKSYYEPVGPQVEADQELYAKLKPYQDEGEKQLKIKAGTIVNGDLNTTRAANTKFGTYLANSYRQIAQADVGILNSGGIRTSLQQGDISYEDILIVNPFANTITTVDLTGQELLDYIQTIVLYDGGAYPQYGGVTFDYDFADNKVKNVKVQGQDLDLNKTYKLAVLSFQANGGDRYPNITKHKSYVDTGFTDAKSMFDWIKANPVIDVSTLPIEGPTWLNKPAAPAESK